ncbi:MAG TPA: hypothetical protein VK646_00150 [Actinomycetota bacterium]|nr:hypothetical protein [Actinomycetota bacterium]
MGERTVVRLERPRTVVWVPVLAVSVLWLAGLLATSNLGAISTWILVAIFGGLAWLSIRGLRVRIVADAAGVRASELFATRRWPWRAIGGFEVSAGRGYLVTSDGGREVLERGAHPVSDRARDEAIAALNAARARRSGP